MINTLKEVVAPIATFIFSWGVAWGTIRARTKAFEERFAQHERENEKRFEETQKRFDVIKCDYEKMALENTDRLARLEEGINLLLRKEGLK